ncbi:unnamed protein product, partial [Protopolystoma xenopodis]
LLSRSKSKRLSCRKKYKIIKKVKEHHRRLRLENKKNPKRFKAKDPGIPNSLPFKEDVIKHVVDTKNKFDQIRSINLLCLKQFKEPELNQATQKDRPCLTSDFLNVIKESDLIIEVIDARDPMGTRCFEAEATASIQNKKLILILNKIDLVPKSNAIAWLNYLRRSYTVLPFKANTQKGKKGFLSSTNYWDPKLFDSEEDVSLRKGFGVNKLLSIITNYSRKYLNRPANKDDKSPSIESSQRILVGIIGLPNTGKSSIINTLKRRKVAIAGNSPGITKRSQIFQLSRHLFVMDSPGVCFPKSSDQCDLVLRNCI